MSESVARASAEVEDLRLAHLVHEDVPGLEIAVDDALLMRVMHGVADPRQELQPLARCEPAALAYALSVLADHQLHREERLPASAGVGGPGLEDLRDSRMLQPPQHLGFLLESAERGRRDESRANHLQRDDSAGPLLLRLVHRAHATRTDQPDDAVVTNLVRESSDADRRRRVGLLRQRSIAGGRYRLIIGWTVSIRVTVSL